MIAWTQGKQLDDYTAQLLALLGERSIPYEAIRVYIPKGPGTDAYWDHNLYFKNHAGQPTGLLVGPYAMRNGEGEPGYGAANVLDMALGKTIAKYEQLEYRDLSTTYTYNVHLGPFGLYGELRPNRIAGSGTYGGYNPPPATFGTPPAILPPPMVEQPKPTPPAPVVQDLSGATTPNASGIAAVNPPAPPAVLGMAEVLAFLLKADAQTIALIQMLLAMRAK